MANVSISTEALVAIKRNRRQALSLGKIEEKSSLVPLLAWSHRSYLTFADGGVVECGPRFVLSYQALRDISEPLIVRTDEGEQVAVRPARKFERGYHRIGFDNNDFTLESYETNPS